MARPRHYVPCIAKELVAVLYHEARYRRMPMTALVHELLTSALHDGVGWRIASACSSGALQTQPDPASPVGVPTPAR